MIWPLVWRSTYLKAVAQLVSCNEGLRETLIQRNQRIVQLETEQAALEAALTVKHVIITPSKPVKPVKMTIADRPSRGGWREQARRASDKTIPVKDSMKELEQRVKDSGGE